MYICNAFQLLTVRKKKALSANSTTVVPGDLPHGILHLFAWVRNDALRACIPYTIIVVYSCYRIVIWLCCCEGPSDDILFFMSVKENTVPVNIRQHGNVVTNSFFSFCWFK